MPENSYDTPTRGGHAPSPAGESDFPYIQGGRYKFICVIGSGGAGTVYKAHDTSLNKEVAIKKLHVASQDQAIRFQREAKLAGSLKHENVMSAIDFGISDRNESYLILDYFSGESLSGLIKRAGRVPIIEALPILIQIADGLAHAHKNGVIHRDIKPSNVLLVEAETPSPGEEEGNEVTREPIAKIVDFGLSKSVHDDQHLTEASIGTPKYMSPEHAHAKRIDERSDVYSFGCLMFETLTGSAPFIGKSIVETVSMHLRVPAPTLKSHGVDCSEHLENIVATCLEKDPDARFQSFDRIGDLLVVELEKVHEGSSDDLNQTLDESERDKPTPRSISRKFVNFAAVSAIIVLAGLILMAIPVLLAPNESDQSTADSSAQKRKRSSISEELRVEENESARGRFATQNDTFRFGIAVGDHAKIRGEELSKAAGGIGETLFVAEGATDKDVLQFFENPANRGARKFDLTDSSLTAKAFDLLATNCKLVHLDYCTQPIDEQTASKILQLKELSDLRLGDTKVVVPEALSSLQKLPKLTVLNIGQAALSERDLIAISQIKSLITLDLNGCTGIDQKALKHILKLPNLVFLLLDGTDVNDEVLSVLIAHPKLEKLGLKRTSVTDAFLRSIENSRYLNLDLRDAPNITKPAVDRLIQAHKNRGTRPPCIDFGSVIQSQGIRF